jgi:hypothetical protein
MIDLLDFTAFKKIQNGLLVLVMWPFYTSFEYNGLQIHSRIIDILLEQLSSVRNTAIALFGEKIVLCGRSFLMNKPGKATEN